MVIEIFAVGDFNFEKISLCIANDLFFSRSMMPYYRLCNEIVEAGRHDYMDLLKTREYHDVDERVCKEMLKNSDHGLSKLGWGVFRLNGIMVH